MKNKKQKTEKKRVKKTQQERCFLKKTLPGLHEQFSIEAKVRHQFGSQKIHDFSKDAFFVEITNFRSFRVVKRLGSKFAVFLLPDIGS
jgi:hypothetical protein